MGFGIELLDKIAFYSYYFQVETEFILKYAFVEV